MQGEAAMATTTPVPPLDPATPVTPAADPTQSTTEPPAEPDPKDLGEAGKKALDNERKAKRAAEKRANDLDKRLKDIEDAGKTEAQRTADAKLEAERERDVARAETSRLRIGIKYQLDEDDLDLLGVGTDDEIEARAKRVKELRDAAAASPANQLTPRPTEQLRPGATPPSMPLNGDELENAIKAKVGLR